MDEEVMKKKIIENNKTHNINETELKELIKKSSKIYKENFNNDVWFERSVFINWTCGIADCKYCYLSTMPKRDMKALRSKESIIAEIIICKAMGWETGYITGGLRVESTDYLIDLIKKVNVALGRKTMMNFGPYSKKEIEALKPYIAGMGSAIESFDEELHKFICPSKPLIALMKFLEHLKENNLQKLITIILGMGEKKEDVEVVIQKIKEYDINTLQLCFLKPQEGTFFGEVESPDPNYMAWWIAKIRIACPKMKIKIALVKDRIHDLNLMLEAGANCFSRFLVFSDFNTKYSKELEYECKKAGRNLKGYWTSLPELDVKKLVYDLDYDEVFKDKVYPKALEYYNKLKKKHKGLNVID